MLPRSFYGIAVALLLVTAGLQGCGGGNSQTAANPIMITGQLPATGTAGTAYSGMLAASGGTPPYLWSVTGFPSDFSIRGTSTANVTVSGTPSASATYTVTATVSDAANQTARSTVSVVIADAGTPTAGCTPRGNESALTASAPFAFLVKGFTSDGPLVIGGSFTPNGDGSVKGGDVEYMEFNALNQDNRHLAVNPAASFYSMDSAGRGCLFLALLHIESAVRSEASSVRGVAFSKKAGSRLPAAVENAPTSVAFSFVLGEQTEAGYQSGRIIEFDQTATGGSIASGIMHVQTPGDFALASLQPNYAFGVDGWDPGRRRQALAGTFHNDSGTISDGVGDFNDRGSAQQVSGEMDGGTGTLSEAIDSSTGRGTGTIQFADVFFNFAFYVVNRSDLYIVSTDPPSDGVDGFYGLFSGQALATQASFAAGALDGSYVLADAGFDEVVAAGNDDGNVVAIGNIQASAAGGILGGNLYTNHTGGFTTAAVSPGSYLTQTSGRTTIDAAGLGAPVIYLTAPSSDENIVGFVVGTDSLVTSGVLYAQTTAAPNFSAGDLKSSFAIGSEQDVDGSIGSLDGVFTFDGAGKYSAVVDVASPRAAPAPGGSATGTFTVNADGSGSLTLDGTGTGWMLLTNGTQIFAIDNNTGGSHADPLLYISTVQRQPK